MALPPSKVIGCEFAGTVVSRGRAVDASSFSLGDRVAGIVHGCHYGHTGAFAEQLVADANLCFRVPDGVPLERACTVGVGWVSAMQALHQRLYKDAPRDAADGNDAVNHAPISTALPLVPRASRAARLGLLDRG